MKKRFRPDLKPSLVCLLMCGLAGSATALTVEADFEGASVREVQTDSARQSIRFMPGGDPARGWPCWWQFRVTGLEPDKPLTLELRGSDLPMPQANGVPSNKPLAEGWAMPERAVYSLDGLTWLQTAPGRRQDGLMIYTLATAAPELFVAWGPPYTPAQASAMVARLADRHEAAFAGELCKSREGRAVPMLRVQEGDLALKSRFGIWVQARQHAWESGASWVCEGFAEWLLGEDRDAAWLRQRAEIFVVPIMDVDNTATGNGGKEALPRDHNRDWTAKPNWNEVAAAQHHLRTLAAEERLDVFLDLHNPAPKDLKAFFFAGPPELLTASARHNRDLFVQWAREKITPVMPMLDEPKLTGPDYHPLWRQISGNWVQAHGNPQTLALCLETPWNTERSHVAGYKAVGAALAQAVQRYLTVQPKRPGTPAP
jgi:hypothetical protein